MRYLLGRDHIEFQGINNWLSNKKYKSRCPKALSDHLFLLGLRWWSRAKEGWWYKVLCRLPGPQTYLDCYAKPQILEILDSLHGASVFSNVDLKSGYWQVDMESNSINKMAFFTSSDLYEFLRLSFGLKNATAVFRRLMEIVLKDFKRKHCFVYIIDIVVYSRNEAEHLVHLLQVFNSLKEAGLTLSNITQVLTFPCVFRSCRVSQWCEDRSRKSEICQVLRSQSRVEV